ncbi:hypothetical protein BDZ89DRAFT_1076345 [Hymenopellis radicata]|nr:hypothetical protein BDZ89DRAFT_1076345 [Hymenopellis radicata]
MATTVSPTSDSVAVTSKHTVRCANETSWTALHSPFRLGPLDALILPYVPIAVVFVYEQTTSTLDVELHSSRAPRTRSDATFGLLSPPNWSPTSQSKRRGSRNCSPGFFFWSGRILMLPGAGNALLAPYDGTLEGVCRDPILTVQHTRFACGASLADADGFFQLVRDMAEMYRGVVSDSKERLQVLDFQPSELYVDPAPSADVSTPLPSSYVPPPSVVGRFLHISSRELNTLKAHATAPTGTHGWISSFDALSAHLCQRIYSARLQLRKKDANQAELRLDLPPHYFPFSLTTTYTTLTHDVLTGPLWKVAKAEMNATLKWIAAQPDKNAIRDHFRYGNGTLMASQWNKFDMYAGTVFDVPPVLVSPPFTPISLVDGLAYFLPNEEQGQAGARDVDSGAIDLNLALSAPLWEILDRDEEFRRFRDV